jgi:2-hydroxy-3-oxopropionate reductase
MPIQEQVAFLGLGVMGLPMASQIAKAGHLVQVYDLFPGPREAAREQGLQVTESASDAVVGSDIVILMLPDTADVELAVRGPDGIASHLATGTVVVDMSSISPIATREIAAALSRLGVGYVDAPVSGGVVGARAGTLSIMAGGAVEDLDRVRNVLGTMGAKVSHMGGVGAGQATKLCNQVAVAINLQAVCEALMLGASLGVDLRALSQALAGGSADSWMLRNLAPQILAGDVSAGFRITLQAKDLRLASEAAAVSDAVLPGLSLVRDLYREALAHGEGDNGNQGLFRVYERLSGRTLKGER